jgi:hypothetical protein
MASSDTVQDKTGKDIHEGETVSTKMRGGKRTGAVEQVVLTEEEAQDVEGVSVKHPPKVVFNDQHGKSWVQSELGRANGRH